MSPEKPTEQFQATLHYFRDDRGIARAVSFICERKTDSTILWTNKNGVIKHVLLLGPGIVKILVDWRNKIGLDVIDIRQEDNTIQINLPANKRLTTIKTGRVAPGFTDKLKQLSLKEARIDLADLKTIIMADNDWQFHNVRNVRTSKGTIEGDNVLDFIAEILRHIPARTIPKREK